MLAGLVADFPGLVGVIGREIGIIVAIGSVSLETLNLRGSQKSGTREDRFSVRKFSSTNW